MSLALHVPVYFLDTKILLTQWYLLGMMQTGLLEQTDVVC